MTRHLLDARVWPADADADTQPLEVDDVNYVSFVNPETHGPPPVLANPKDQSMKANIEAEIQEHGDVTVLYINPASILAAEVTRRA